MFGQLLPNKKQKNSDSAQCFVHRIGELNEAKGILSSPATEFTSQRTHHTAHADMELGNLQSPL
jgi:hypothetical protein